ncbi:hypothetical protein FisN_3Lh276 [Fistulifera solaris]|uniref:Uncharacterized protein n=1 Tax=Fistulifera solaris TaxID=1519565 RepID=A0A1Z5JPD9_FISSO|nr:hypothetical protein FisN_3Lh276 [Fistulifera solaris]|eukprot:GAX15829.1 hypothetical protein FisN_3Lh276 [Fistulifera solaris]
MVSDITALTASLFHGEEGESTGQKSLANKALKTMWRFIQSLIKLCSLSPGRLSTKVMRRLVCTLLGCTKCLVDPQDIEPRLPETLFRISQYWCHPPTTHRKFLEDHYAAEPMDFAVYRSSGSVWMDSQSETAIIPSIWTYLLLTCAGGTMQEEAVDQLGDAKIQTMVLLNLGYVEIVKALRAHFFGRDMVDFKNEQIVRSPRYELNLGHFEAISTAKQQEEREKNTMNSKPYEKIPSRLHAVLTFLALVKDSGDAKALRSTIAEFIPICYELLGASNDVSIGKGSIVLLHLLFMTEVHFNAGDCPRTLIEQAENLFTALDIVAKTCRDGRTLVMVGSAQRHLLRLLQSKRSDVQMRRRQATQQWFTILDTARHRTSDEKLVWGLLVVVIPFLYDHVQQENADAMEIGRLGLSALLAVVRLTDTSEFSVHGHQVPLLAVVALSNLLVAAHPIMHKHANKLICELVACLVYLSSQEEKESTDNIEKEKRLIVLHVAAETAIICGNNADRCIARLKEENFSLSLKSCLDDVVSTAQVMHGAQSAR